jgi:Stage II sporulation protein M
MIDKSRMCKFVRHLLWRVFFLFLGATTFVASYYYGATLHLGTDQAKIIAEQISTKNKGIDQSAIFFNNIKPAAGMFIPAFGAGLGFYSGYSTGLVISAFKELSPGLKSVSPVGPLLRPFGIMEVIVYSIAISRSGMLTYQLIKRKGLRQSSIYTGIEIGIVVVILLIASIIEWQEIERRLQLGL